MNAPLSSLPEPDYHLAGQTEETGAPASPFRIQRFVSFLLKFWWVPLLTTLIGVGTVAVFVLLKAPTYVSKAHMWETVKLRLPEGSLFTEDVQNVVGTQTELLQSATLRDLALARLRSSSNTVTVPLGADREPLPVTVRVTAASKSAVFVIEATGSVAAYTQAYLEALMAVYLEYKQNVRKEVSGVTLASISEQVQVTERELKEHQDALLAFQRTNNLAILQQEGAVAGGYLATLKTKLSDLELEERLLKATAVQSVGAAEELTNATSLTASAYTNSITSGTETPERQNAFKEVELLKIQRERLSKHLRPKHPKIVKLDADIERGEKLMEIFRRQNREQLAASRQTTQLKMESVQASIREWERKVVEANSRMAEAERLKLNVQRVQSIYDRLALLVQNVAISRNIDQETLSILEHASAARRSYSRELGLLGVAGLGGLGIGAGLIFLVAVRDDRFGSAVEISDKFGDSIVGQLPEVPAISGNGTLPLLEADDKRHMYAEAYRNLRSALLFLAVEGKRPKVLLITSAVPDEGKSTVAANLALTLALGGSRVVLVDADLRRGQLHELMGLQCEPGLSELLRQTTHLDRALQYNSLPNLGFISCGNVVSNPGDLFLASSFDAVLGRLREEFDYVLIDSSPVFAADDATTLAPKVDGTLFIVRNSFSRAAMVRQALELLYQRQAKVLGLVFNRADASSRSYYYYKQADYYLPGKAT